MQLSLVEQAGQQYYLRSKQTSDTASLLKAIVARPLPDMITNNQIIKYL